MLKMPHIYLLLFSLYWAQGLPVGFMTHALPVILRSEGVSLSHIGGFGLLMAPWALKVFWAPWVDHYGNQRIGHYRSWILPTQLLSIVVLIVLSFLPIQALNQPLYLLGFFIALLMINTLGATQDIATDALAVRMLNGQQQHMGNMFQVIGSRLGFIVGGGAILWALDWLSWQRTFLVLAAIVFINSLPILFYREAAATEIASQHIQIKRTQIQQPPLSWALLYQQYAAYFFKEPQLRTWLWVLITIKITDGLSGPLLKPLLVDLGLNFSQIGIYITMLGAVAAILGAALASICLSYASRAVCLMLFSVAKLISLAGFTGLAILYAQHQSVPAFWIYLINAFEDLCAAMLLVVVLTLVMQYSRPTHAGTDFTFQVSVMALISGGLYTLSGFIGDWLGYAHYLSWILVLGVLLLLPIMYWWRHSRLT